MDVKLTMEKLRKMEMKLKIMTEDIQLLIQDLDPEREESLIIEKLEGYKFISEFIDKNGEDWNQTIQKKFFSQTSKHRGVLSVSQYLSNIGVETYYHKENRSEWAILTVHKQQILNLIAKNK